MPKTVTFRFEGPGDCARCLEPMTESVRVFVAFDEPIAAVPELGIPAITGVYEYRHPACDPADTEGEPS